MDQLNKSFVVFLKWVFFFIAPTRAFYLGNTLRLLLAERLPGRIVDAARYLAAKGVATNTEDFGRLLFSRRDDLARRRIAAAYFRHLHAKS